MRLLRQLLLIGSLPLAAGGCGNLFDVENPGAIGSEDLDNTGFIAALSNTAIASGQESLSNWISTGGMAGNDFSEPSTCANSVFLDLGLVDTFGNGVDATYDNLAADQWTNDEAVARLRKLVPNPDSHVAVGRGYYWGGLLMVERAEFFQQITFSGGPPFTPVQVLDMAVKRLTQAVTVLQAATGDNTNYIAAAYGTMARAERQLYFETNLTSWMTSAAVHAAQALTIRPTYRLDALYTTAPGVINGLWNSYGPGRGNSVGCGGLDPAYLNRVDLVTKAKDPRMPMTSVVGNGARGPVFYSLKYPSNSSPIPVSRWQEARLIIAEERLVANDLAGAVNSINLVRTAAGLQGFQSAEKDAIQQMVISERVAEFWEEGRDWTDLRNYSIFPVGWNAASRAAGIKRRFPISQREIDGNDNL